jgi:hypothetical protein
VDFAPKNEFILSEVLTNPMNTNQTCEIAFGSRFEFGVPSSAATVQKGINAKTQRHNLPRRCAITAGGAKFFNHGLRGLHGYEKVAQASRLRSPLFKYFSPLRAFASLRLCVESLAPALRAFASLRLCVESFAPAPSLCVFALKTRLLLAFQVAILLFCANAFSETAGRDGKIEFSDGKTIAGIISLTPGSELKIQAGPKVRVLALGQVREIRMSPENEEMERQWRFKEAGQTAKEFFGEPYPVRNLAATVTLAGGETVAGHLYTTVLYVEAGENVEKVILPAKQRGDEGQSFKSLVYPARISFTAAAAAVETTVTLRLKLPGIGAQSQVAALTRGALVHLDAQPGGVPGEYSLPAPLGKEVFLAVKNGGKIIVGWPRTPAPRAMALVRNALPASEDFFDDRRLLGVFADEANSDIYSLVLALRTKKTTLDEKRSQPWRLEIYRWKQDDEGERVMLAGQGYLFRDITAKNEPAPTVELSDKLWTVRKQDGAWLIGD